MTAENRDVETFKRLLAAYFEGQTGVYQAWVCDVSIAGAEVEGYVDFGDLALIALQVWGNPADVLAAMIERTGASLDPEKVAELRRLASEG